MFFVNTDAIQLIVFFNTEDTELSELVQYPLVQRRGRFGPTEVTERAKSPYLLVPCYDHTVDYFILVCHTADYFFNTEDTELSELVQTL